MSELDRQIDGLGVLQHVGRQRNGLAIAEAMRAVTSPFSDYRIFHLPGQIVVGGTVTAGVNGELHVFVSGVHDSGQARSLAAGYLFRSGIRVAERFNAAAWNEAVIIWNQLVSSQVDRDVSIVLYGHSSGGVVCECLAWIAQRAYEEQEIEINTYGAPCPSEGSGVMVTANARRNRWMLQQDVVPWFPFFEPSGLNALILFTVNLGTTFTPTERPAPERFRQPLGGRIITSRSMREAYLSPIGPDQQQKMQGWLDGGDDQTEHHTVAAYRATMIAFDRNHPEIVEITPRGAPQAPPPQEPIELTPIAPSAVPMPAPSIEVIAVQPNGIALDSTGRQVGTATRGVNEMSFIKINPRHAFKKVKVGKVWKVTLDGQIIMTCDEGKTPGAVVKRGNALLRSLGTSNTVFISDFVNALDDWMRAATSNEQYARPTMKGQA